MPPTVVLLLLYQLFRSVNRPEVVFIVGGGDPLTAVIRNSLPDRQLPSLSRPPTVGCGCAEEAVV